MMETVVEYISLLLIPLIAIYLHRIFFFFSGLNKLSRGANDTKHSVTIIVPARNEEHNIERCLHSLSAQKYEQNKISIIVIDDQSTDRTGDIVKRVAQTASIPILVFTSSEHSEITSPKIRAFAHGIQHATGSIILTTDADCIVSPNWVSNIVSYFEDGVGVVTGTTVYEKNKKLTNLFWGIQFLDFLSYTAIAAGAIGMNRILVSNGSNMAFRREAFDSTGGFEALKHINTGDDSLLAQNIVRSKKWSARFAISPEATVTTQPALTLRAMLHQRFRWVGQTAYYPPYMMFFMISTFIMFVALAITLPLTLVEWNAIPWIVFVQKFFIDYITMSRFTRLTKTEETMKYFIPTAFIHIPMILIATVGGYFFSFEWKERTLKKEAIV